MKSEPFDCIYHISPNADWLIALSLGEYAPNEAMRDGFIHFSTRTQIMDTAMAFYHGRKDLVLLQVDPTRLTAELIYDVIDSGKVFPHLYGPLNLDAVTQVADFSPDECGEFTFPFAEADA